MTAYENLEFNNSKSVDITRTKERLAAEKRQKVDDKGILMSYSEIDRGGCGRRGTEEMDRRGEHVNEKGLCI